MVFRRVDNESASVDGTLGKIKSSKPYASEKHLESLQREVAKVLVVDRIVLILLHYLRGGMYLHRHNAIARNEIREALRKISGICHMRHDVARENGVGGA